MDLQVVTCSKNLRRQFFMAGQGYCLMQERRAFTSVVSGTFTPLRKRLITRLGMVMSSTLAARLRARSTWLHLSCFPDPASFSTTCSTWSSSTLASSTSPALTVASTCFSPSLTPSLVVRAMGEQSLHTTMTALLYHFSMVAPWFPVGPLHVSSLAPQNSSLLSSLVESPKLITSSLASISRHFSLPHPTSVATA